MRNTTMVPILVLIIFGVTLGVSSERIRTKNSKNVEDFMRREIDHEEKMRDASIGTFGRSRSSVDLKFGVNSNEKTNQRRYTTLQNSPGREPSIQAYGLPKRTLENNGNIERVSLDRVSGLDGKVDKVNVHTDQSGIHAYGLSKRVLENNGFIERVGLPESSVSSSGNVVSLEEPKSSVRRIRSVDGFAKNDLLDLEPQEAKVFRPLFVYRQQIADRYRVKQKKNPIYGAYQYGAKRQKNSSHASHKYY